ncbi:hypothetical protein MLD38_022076 [Melastoma candidum]|uniref:Uncharacterized protein n=1 Tax=Melastoma candidum TaxID=119954 RepID=A0ACB9QJX0_9MYRT|nr:hypothetical protein MLD38_022076 [Melastoma candidum]
MWSSPIFPSQFVSSKSRHELLLLFPGVLRRRRIPPSSDHLPRRAQHELSPSVEVDGIRASFAISPENKCFPQGLHRPPGSELRRRRYLQAARSVDSPSSEFRHQWLSKGYGTQTVLFTTQKPGYWINMRLPLFS